MFLKQIMEESKENITFKSLSEEEFYNQPDNTEKSENVSSKCVFARYVIWIFVKRINHNMYYTFILTYINYALYTYILVRHTIH